MKLLATTTALGLLMALGAVAPASADADTIVEVDAAPVWMASVISLADDSGLALVQDEDEDCEDDEDEDEDEEDEEDEEEDDEEDDEEEEDEDEDEDEEECEADEDELA